MSNKESRKFSFKRPTLKKKQSRDLVDLNKSEMNKSVTSNGRKSIQYDVKTGELMLDQFVSQ